jgi:N-acetylglucosaminyl-diphospho-decaprenol L-rhamnosyltransferase
MSDRINALPRSIHVIIVTHNTRADLLSCLSSLATPRSGSVERITVVDNASADGTVDVLRDLRSDVEIIALDRNVGFGAANNVAARQSSSDHLLFLNSDTIVPAGAIDKLFARFLDRGATAAGPRLVDADGAPEVSFGKMLSPWSEARQVLRQRLATAKSIERLLSTERVVDWVSGACLLVSRSAFVAAGGFDERFFMYEEDVDLCATLRSRGGTVLFTPRATITHLKGRSGGPAGTRSVHYDRSHVAFYAKHAPAWVPWLRGWLRIRGRSIE